MAMFFYQRVSYNWETDLEISCVNSMFLPVARTYPSVIKHGVLENGRCFNDFPIKTSIPRQSSIAMFDYQRVLKKNLWKSTFDPLPGALRQESDVTARRVA